MNIFWCISFTTIAVLCAFTAAEVADKEATTECFRKAWYPLASDGNLNTEEYIILMLAEKSFIGSDATKDLVKNGIEACSNDGAKTDAEFRKTDSCVFDLYVKHCEEAAPWIAKVAQSEDLKTCMP